jgi:hypothetical protein
MGASAFAGGRSRLLAVGLGPAIALGIAFPAQADRGDYVVRSFSEPANPGLAVTGPLEEFSAVTRARVVVPAEWQRLNAKAGQVRFITPRQRCRYRVTFAARSRLDVPRDPAEYVAGALRPAGPGYLLESGQRLGSAFVVIRERSTDSVVRLRAVRAAVLTRRPDIAPTGQVAWSEVIVTAASRRGDECHAGTYRDRLGPQLGDALATARTRLHFVRKQS